MIETGAFQIRAASTADLLRRAGAQAGRPVIAITASSQALAILACAAPATGAPLFPLDPALPRSLVADMLGQIGACLSVGDGQTLSTETILAAAPAPPMDWGPQQGPALLIATSGTSGRPKIVTLTGENLVAAASASAKITPLRPGDRWLACLPLFHIGGYSIITRCALAGAEAVLHQGFSAESVARALTAERISHLSLTPTMLALLLAEGTRPPPHLRHVLIGGAALSTPLAQKAIELSWPLQPTYGMSETASQLATLPFLPRRWQAGHFGRPLDGIEIALTEDGRLKTRGPMVMAGYANQNLSPGEGLEGGWFVTSDLAEITGEGDLIVLGRADDAIVSGGKKAHPSRIEDLLSHCPGLEAVGVAGRPDPVWGEIVTAIFCGGLTAQDLLAWSRTHIESAFRPRAAIRVAALPLLSNGKPDRSALRELALRDEAESGPAGQI